MNAAKPWYESKTIWGSLITISATVLGVFGVELDPETQSDLVVAALQMATVAGSLIAIYGRVSATTIIE